MCPAQDGHVRALHVAVVTLLYNGHGASGDLGQTRLGNKSLSRPFSGKRPTGFAGRNAPESRSELE